MVITRFAPSPTGYLHIGSARTALFSYLFAKRNNGKFLLRIEDTDRERSTQEATDAILTSMKWLELDHDGEIIYQSKRTERYKEAAQELLNSGKAYYCFSSQDEIETERQNAISKGQSFIFHSPWRDKDQSSYPKDIKPVVRLKTSHLGSTILKDLVQGSVEVENSHIDDMVLLRADGTPTYMLAVVVDDHDMGITHIIRGDDHLTNATRQIAIYKAFGWDIPEMAHIPLIHGPDGAKLSKRHGAVGVEWYKDEGYLPEALCNYLVRLGWSHGDDEFISREQATAWFDLANVGKSPSRIDFDKLKHVNAHYIKNYDNVDLHKMVVDALATSYDKGIIEQSSAYLMQGMDGLKVRAHLLTELIELSKIYLIGTKITISTDALETIKNTDKKLIDMVILLLSSLQQTPLNHDILQDKFKELATNQNMKLGDLMKPLRVLLTGSTSSPSLFEIISIIGIQNTIIRIEENYLKYKKDT